MGIRICWGWVRVFFVLKSGALQSFAASFGWLATSAAPPGKHTLKALSDLSVGTRRLSKIFGRLIFVANCPLRQCA